MKVCGKNVFNEIKNNPEKIRKLILSKSSKNDEVISFAKKNKIKFEFMDPKIMDKMVGRNHQGIIAVVEDFEYANISDVLNDDIIVMLDHLEDPHNLGAIIRTCEAAGIKSIIIPRDRSVTVNETVMKISSGALEHVKIVQVPNLVNTINDLKKENYFVYTADMDGINYKNVDFNEKCVLIVGSEGNGVSRLVREASDVIVSMPMKGKVNSLNASVAAAVLIYGVVNR